MGKKTDPGTSIEHSLKSGAEASEILAGIACTNTALRLAARQLTNLYDEALEPTELKAKHVPPCSHGADAARACAFPQSTEERRPSRPFGGLSRCSRQRISQPKKLGDVSR